MKKSTRRILALALSLALVCALAVSAFGLTRMNSNFEDYTYGDIVMIHEIIGYDIMVEAVISFTYDDGTSVEDEFQFAYSGNIDYQYCREDQVRPSYYIGGSKSGSDTLARGSSASVCTNTLASGYAMIDASMRFTTQFVAGNANINHNRPDTIYVGIY